MCQVSKTDKTRPWWARVADGTSIRTSMMPMSTGRRKSGWVGPPGGGYSAIPGPHQGVDRTSPPPPPPGRGSASKTVDERREIVEQALHSTHMAGLSVTPTVLGFAEAYVRGEIDSDELGQRVRDLYFLPPPEKQ